MPNIETDNRWIETFTGKSFFPLDPEPDKICIEDITHALSMLCRFNGHCKVFYSIAEHSIRVANFVKQTFYPYTNKRIVRKKRDLTIELYALLHDSAEAYNSDIPRPIKSSLTNFKDIENKILEIILEKFCLTNYISEDYKKFIQDADDILLATEARDLGMKLVDHWKLRKEPLFSHIIPYRSIEMAQKVFFRKFSELQRKIDEAKE